MDKEIRKFWLWWEKNEALIRQVLDRGSADKLEELKEHLDRKILSFGHFTWEIKVGELKRYCFIISPNRDEELLQLSRQIMAEAPSFSHWEFAYARGVESLVQPFKLYDGNFDPVQISPEYWQLDLADGVVTVRAEELNRLDPETRDHAMELVVTAYYGEEFRITQIHEIVLG